MEEMARHRSCYLAAHELERMCSLTYKERNCGQVIYPKQSSTSHLTVHQTPAHNGRSVLNGKDQYMNKAARFRSV